MAGFQACRRSLLKKQKILSVKGIQVHSLSFWEGRQDWEVMVILCYSSKFKASLGYLIPDLRKRKKEKSRPLGAGVFSALEVKTGGISRSRQPSAS